MTMSLTFSRQMRRDARLGPPPVGPGALILPAGREERSGGKGLRGETDKVKKDKRTKRSFITCSGVEEKRVSGPGVSNISDPQDDFSSPQDDFCQEYYS